MGGVGPILSHTSWDETRDLNSGEAFTLPPPTSSFIAKWGHDQAQSPGILENIIILLSSRRNRKPPGLSNNPRPLQRPSYLTSGMVSLTKPPRRQLKRRLCFPLRFREFHCFWVSVEAENKGSGSTWTGRWSLTTDHVTRCKPSGHTGSLLPAKSPPFHHLHWVICFVACLFWDRVSLCSLGCPKIHK